MAVVYKAFDERIKRTVALKVLYSYLADREENKKRFQREAQVAASLKHRNIVSVYDYSGLDSSENYIVAEFIQGTTLKRFRSEHRIKLPEVAAMIVEQIAAALQHAHENGVTHRDVKPENVMIDSDGTLKLTDFGIAQMKNLQQMTVTGTMIGSPAHMSPEHIEGRKLDHRADIFSLGTVFYVLAVGELPFEGNSAHALLKNILDVNYVSATRACPPVGKPLSDMIDRCMARHPEDRYQTCRELQLDLQQYLEQFGYTDTTTELARFFNQPELYQEHGRQQVVERLVEMGKARVRSGRVGEALRLFDRALSLDEFRKDVLQEIERLRRSVEFKRLMFRYVAPLLALTALLGGGGYAAFQTDMFGLFAAPPEPALPAEARHVPDAMSPLALPAPEEQKLLGDPGARTGGGTTKAEEKTSESESSPTVAVGPADPTDPALDVAMLTWRPALPEHQRLGLEALASTASMPTEALEKRLSLVVPPEKHPEQDGTGHKGDAATGPRRDRKTTDGTADSKTGEDAAKRETPDGTGAQGGGPKSEVEKALALVPVTIRGQPPAVELFVDERKVGTGKVVGLPLAVGDHRLRLHHPTCAECMDTLKTFVVRADGPAPNLKERINFKPATLLVRCQLPGIVFVDGEQAGRTNRRIILRASSPQPWEVAVKILFDDATIPWHEGRHLLRAGKTTILRP